MFIIQNNDYDIKGVIHEQIKSRTCKRSDPRTNQEQDVSGMASLAKER